VKRKPVLLMNPRLRKATAAERQGYELADMLERVSETLWGISDRIRRRQDRSRSSKPRVVKL
jgi:hypothetical protein